MSFLQPASCKADINTIATYTGDFDNSEGRSFEYIATTCMKMVNHNPNPIWYDFLVQNIQQSRDVFIPRPTLSGSRRRRNG